LDLLVPYNETMLLKCPSLKAFIPYEEIALLEGLFLDYSSSSSSEASAGKDILNNIGSTESAFSKEEDAPEKLSIE
jgi:hypothetical protein